MARGLGIDVDRLFAITFALGSGLAGLGGALAIAMLGLDPSFALTYLIYVLIVVSVGGLGSIAGSFVGCDVARRERYGGQVLHSGVWVRSHLSGHDGGDHVAAGRPVREALGVTSATIGAPDGPQEFLRAQIRWRWSEIAFWLATLLPFVLAPDYLVLASQIAFTALLRAIARSHPRVFRHHFARPRGLFRRWRLYRRSPVGMGLGEPLTGLAVAGLAAGLFGYLTSFIIARFRHLALIMITLGIALLLQEAANSASAITGGFDGLQGIDTWPIFNRFDFDLYGRTAYGYTLAILFLLFLVARRIIHSPFGLASTRHTRESRRACRRSASPTRADILHRLSPSPPSMAGIAGALLAQTTQIVVARSAGLSTLGRRCW